MANIPISNNIIYTQVKGSETKNGRETILLGAELVTVGVQSENKEIATDKVTGEKYERNEIQAQEIYKLKTQKRRPYFALDLETGGRGWYPGAVHAADITGTDIEIKSEPSETSQTIITVTNVTVKVLDLVYDSAKNIWYNISYNDYEGYVRNTYISNVRYIDPE